VPFQTNKSLLIEKIALLVREKKNWRHIRH
jgi:DNA gyrase/topoisomerase IV subunit A